MHFDDWLQGLLGTSQSFRKIDLYPTRIGCRRNQVSKLLCRLLIKDRFAAFGSVQVLDKPFHPIVDATDPNASLFAIQSEHHRLLIVDRSHEIVWVVAERYDVEFTLVNTRLVDVRMLFHSDFERTLQYSNRRLQLVIQRQVWMVLE